MAFPKLISEQESICESESSTPPSLHLSIEIPLCCFPCPCRSVDCSFAWTCRPLVPCLIANVRLPSWRNFSWTFNTPVFFQTNPILAHIIVIGCCFHRKIEKWKWQLSEISGGQSCVSLAGLLVVTYCWKVTTQVDCHIGKTVHISLSQLWATA